MANDREGAVTGTVQTTMLGLADANWVNTGWPFTRPTQTFNRPFTGIRRIYATFSRKRLMMHG